MGSVILKMEGITKAFPGVKALKGVSFDLREGEVHALLGENGAGKSTLMKCLAGIYSVDSGTIEYNGLPVVFKNAMESIHLGISVIHQELALAEQLTVADNMFAGQEPLGKLGLINRRAIHTQCQAILRSLDANFTSYDRVFTLSTAQKQMLEIAKAINRRTKVLVMDEPTAAVSHKEVEKIFRLIGRLRDQGITIVYISHRMDEIFRVADRITVLRDGANVKTVMAKEIDKDALVRMMVGYSLDRYYQKNAAAPGEVVLEAQNITRRDNRVRNASFTLRRGEIVGFAGLVGSGRTELIETIFGLCRLRSGQILLKGNPVRFRSPEDALKAGICLVPEDRKLQGLILDNTVRFNLTLGVLRQFMGMGHINRKKENEIANRYVESLSIKVPSLHTKAISLSGGNQQKIVLSKWLAASTAIMILDEPTRGIDVGAKAEIYALMDRLAASGVSIIMVSSELPEVLGMSDRIYVMREGEIKTCVEKEQFNQEEILKYALGVREDG